MARRSRSRVGDVRCDGWTGRAGRPGRTASRTSRRANRGRRAEVLRAPGPSAGRRFPALLRRISRSLRRRLSPYSDPDHRTSPSVLDSAWIRLAWSGPGSYGYRNTVIRATATVRPVPIPYQEYGYDTQARRAADLPATRRSTSTADSSARGRFRWVIRAAARRSRPAPGSRSPSKAIASTRRRLFTRGTTVRLQGKLEPLNPVDRRDDARTQSSHPTAGCVSEAGPGHGAPRERAGRIRHVSTRVMPSDAVILVDGEAWARPPGENRFSIDLAEGPHQVEVREKAAVLYVRTVEILAGEPSRRSVSLYAGGTWRAVGSRDSND